MEVSKKYKYTVTDPCYLLSDEDWHRCWEEADHAATGHWDDQVMCEAVERCLREANKGFAFACNTGFGDWSNNIHSMGGNGVKILNQEFGADAGMVCVVEVTPALEEYLSKDKTNSYNIGAFFESEEKVTHVNCVGDRNWEVLEIRTRNGAIIETDPYDDVEYNVIFREDYRVDEQSVVQEVNNYGDAIKIDDTYYNKEYVNGSWGEAYYYMLVQKDAGVDIPLAVGVGSNGRKSLEFMRDNEYDKEQTYDIVQISASDYISHGLALDYDLFDLLTDAVRNMGIKNNK